MQVLEGRLRVDKLADGRVFAHSLNQLLGHE